MFFFFLFTNVLMIAGAMANTVTFTPEMMTIDSATTLSNIHTPYQSFSLDNEQIVHSVINKTSTVGGKSSMDVLDLEYNASNNLSLTFFVSHFYKTILSLLAYGHLYRLALAPAMVFVVLVTRLLKRVLCLIIASSEREYRMRQYCKFRRHSRKWSEASCRTIPHGIIPFPRQPLPSTFRLSQLFSIHISGALLRFPFQMRPEQVTLLFQRCTQPVFTTMATTLPTDMPRIPQLVGNFWWKVQLHIHKRCLEIDLANNRFLVLFNYHLVAKRKLAIVVDTKTFKVFCGFLVPQHRRHQTPIFSLCPTVGVMLTFWRTLPGVAGVVDLLITRDEAVQIGPGATAHNLPLNPNVDPVTPDAAIYFTYLAGITVVAFAWAMALLTMALRIALDVLTYSLMVCIDLAVIALNVLIYALRLAMNRAVNWAVASAVYMVIDLTCKVIYRFVQAAATACPFCVPLNAKIFWEAVFAAIFWVQDLLVTCSVELPCMLIAKAVETCMAIYPPVEALAKVLIISPITTVLDSPVDWAVLLFILTPHVHRLARMVMAEATAIYLAIGEVLEFCMATYVAASDIAAHVRGAVCDA